MWTPIFGLMPLLLAFQSAITPVTAGFIQGVDGVWLRHGKGGDVGRLDPRDNDVFTFKVVIGKYEGNCQTANVRSSAAEHKIGWDYDKKKFCLKVDMLYGIGSGSGIL